jgi:beta-phosphoglucomutase
MNKYEAILFDFDGVLVDSEPVHFVCWQEILKPFGLELDWQTYSEQGIGVSDRAMLSVLCKQSDPPLDIELLAAEYPRKKDMFRTRMLATPAVSRAVIDLLDALAGYKLAFVTSSGRNEVEPILEASGVRSRFDTAVFGGDVKNLKPAPDPYRLAVERLGVSRALVIEDSEAGAASGYAAGLDVLKVAGQQEMPGLVRARLGLY